MKPVLEQFIGSYWDALTHPERLQHVDIIGLSREHIGVEYSDLNFMQRKAITGYVVGFMFDDLKIMIQAGLL